MPVSQPITRESRVIFSRGDRGFTSKDVIDCALVRGEVDPLWKEFVRAAECDRMANEEQLELDGSAIDSAVTEFRYKRDLITAEETERWLDDRGVSLAEFGEYFARQYWGRNYSGVVDLLQSSYQAAPTEEKDLFLVDLILSGSLVRMADRLTYRICAQVDEGSDDDADVAKERARFLAETKIDQEELPDWLAQLGRDNEWLDQVLAAEVAYKRQVSRIVTEQALQKELVPMRLNLTRFELETVEVDSRDAAAEVVACVRNDGMEMSEVAEEGRYPFRRSEVLLEDIPSEQQQRFWSVKAGALFDPIPRGDGFEVWRVKVRTEPTLQDEVIRARLEKIIVDRCFNQLLSKYIVWNLYVPLSE